MTYVSIHADRAIAKAKKNGAFSGDDAARELWALPKREILEIALRLTMEDGVDAAIKRVHEEREILQRNKII